MVFYPGQQISMRRTALLAADIISIVAAIVAAAVIRLGWADGLEYCFNDHIIVLLACVANFLAVFYACGMYERQTLTRKDGSYFIPLIAVAVALGLTIVASYADRDMHIGRGILALAGTFMFLSAWLIRYAYRTAAASGLLSKKALVIGEGAELEEVIHLVQHTADPGFKLTGCITLRRHPAGTFIAGIPVVASTGELRETVEAFEIETVIVATSLARESAILRILRPLRWGGIEVMDYTSLHERLAQEIPLDHINDEWLMNAAMNSSVVHIRKLKRMMDIAVSAIGLILGALPFALAALLVRLDSPGPIIYRQRRAGRDGHTYELYKLRTMRADAETSSGAVWAGKTDPRITRTGKYLRQWRLDEIPQLWNILLGQMSLVGPRPERPEFIETLDNAIPFYKERLQVPPGLTGWAQVKYPYAASIEAARRKLQYDLYYIKHMSLALDLLILLRTFKTVLVGFMHSGEETVTHTAAQTQPATPPPGEDTEIRRALSQTTPPPAPLRAPAPPPRDNAKSA